jgi:hypothetical protein
MTKRADDSHPTPPNLDELISLREASEISGLSASHLRLLVSRGAIWDVTGAPYVSVTAVQFSVTADADGQAVA